jgi:hypothetical protein
MKDFHTDNGSEFLNWALHRHLTGRAVRLPWTRSRATARTTTPTANRRTGRMCGSFSATNALGILNLVPLMNQLYAQEWSQWTNHFKPTFKRLRPDKKDGKTQRIYEKQPQTPYQRLLASPDIPKATKARMRAEHAGLDPFALKKRIEDKLKSFFTVLGNLDRESTKTGRSPASVTFNLSQHGAASSTASHGRRGVSFSALTSQASDGPGKGPPCRPTPPMDRSFPPADAPVATDRGPASAVIPQIAKASAC